MRPLRGSFFLKFLLLAVVLLSAVLLGSAVGAAGLPLRAVLKGPIFWQVRLPRLCACLLCGAGLAVSGLLSQTLLSNPLSSPTLLGVNSGAGFAVALAGAFLPLGGGWLPFAAFLGALLASLLIFAVSCGHGHSRGSRRSVLLLAGVALSSILSAGIETMHTLFPGALPGYNSFLLGNFGGVGWARLSPAWVGMVCCLLASLCLAGPLDIFALGDEAAAALGLRVNLTRGAALLLSAALAGAAVSVCGLLGFVGLMSPHLARALFGGGKHRILLPASALLGAALVVFCDTLSRTLFAPYELPAGIALSFVGGPFFLYLLLRRKRHA
ncbi:MAG: iron ABC transporter permease [Oscillospiraceae bacterium]|jgi:iron complex transport system permease protein|nr:iron ABC transporter permease [Oscillospiraceae bacterium]